MEIKWYWLAEQLGLMQDLTEEYNDGSIHYIVSAKADEVFMNLALAMFLVMFFIGFVIRLMATMRNTKKTGQTALRWCMGILLLYAVLLAVGVGPYIEFYPKGGGFIDFSVLGHIVEGVYWCFLALSMFLGGKLGHFLGRKKQSTDTE